MEIIYTVQDMQRRADDLRKSQKKIGFVPTMGFLHEGHLSLLEIAVEESDVAVLSVFINPIQFGPDEDLYSYPFDFEHDKNLARDRGCDIIFKPEVKEMYHDPYRTYVTVKEITALLCGASRPIHFQGVTTAVSKLFNIVKPHVTVFGQKDAQQAIIIRQMVKDLNYDIDVLIAPIIREEDGLAMSSRNVYLSNQERKDALVLYRSLCSAENMIVTGCRDAEEIKLHITKIIDSVSSSKIDYIELVDTRDLKPVGKLRGEILLALAAWIGKTRLIDNVILKSEILN